MLRSERFGIFALLAAFTLALAGSASAMPSSLIGQSRTFNCQDGLGQITVQDVSSTEISVAIELGPDQDFFLQMRNRGNNTVFIDGEYRLKINNEWTRVRYEAPDWGVTVCSYR